MAWQEEYCSSLLHLLRLTKKELSDFLCVLRDSVVRKTNAKNPC